MDRRFFSRTDDYEDAGIKRAHRERTAIVYIGEEIVINVSEKKGYDVITVKNRISGSVLSENPDLISTKDDNEKHGLGVKQIKDIVASYDGMTDFYEEDDFFIVSIFIPA